MLNLSKTNYRGTGCVNGAPPGLWGSGEVTNRSTRSNFTQKKFNVYLVISYNNRKNENRKINYEKK